MSYIFYGYNSLEQLNISNLKTYNVTKMISMFGECSSLKELDLSNFNTKNVTHMNNMFINCSSLKKNKFIKF